MFSPEHRRIALLSLVQLPFLNAALFIDYWWSAPLLGVLALLTASLIVPGIVVACHVNSDRYAASTRFSQGFLVALTGWLIQLLATLPLLPFLEYFGIVETINLASMAPFFSGITGLVSAIAGIVVDRRRARREAMNTSGGQTHDTWIWGLVKNGHTARALARQVPGVGVELRFYWDDGLRHSQVFRSSVELAEAASKKREELMANGWIDQPMQEWGTDERP